MYVVESFFSIQGEGKFIGTPSIFIRFGGCNMSCEGFTCSEVVNEKVTLIGCDSIYAVNHEHFSHTWQKIENLEELIKHITKHNISYSCDVVLTGGEPLIYSTNNIFLEFLEYLHVNKHRVTFETNASISIDFDKYPIYKEMNYSMSVKLSNSNEDKKKRINSKNISNIALHVKDSFFKFVISENNQIDEIEEIASYAPSLPIYCMAMCNSKNELEDRSLFVVEFCKKNGYIYNDRLHIRLWDKKKGI
ncbi:MAG: 7-carboxy-7-deazaguanine synthase QueE [Campylobacterota bacterium]|nr:7-carboxy-7-deazaguanine synthase QueE [Campylobacterota bacterium]